MRIARFSLAVGSAVSAIVIGAGPALACGGLVGENGTIQLTKTVTLAAYHDGVEHYVTSFEFTGQGKEVGSIVPLPGVPSTVERGGDWTLQRLELEVAPPLRDVLAGGDAVPTAAKSAEVILETKIDALEITVLKGGADEVGRWALDHGFFLPPDAPEVLDFYAQRSPIFMAARFDAQTAADLGQNAGDGTPIQVTIPTSQPWVPLRILSLGLDGGEFVNADVFLLTDESPQLLVGGSGLTVARSERASDFLLDDLRSDEGTAWIPPSSWLTYLQLAAPASELDYDLAISATPGKAPSRADAGLTLTGDRGVPVLGSGVHGGILTGSGNEKWLIVWATVGVIGIGLILFGLGFTTARARQ